MYKVLQALLLILSSLLTILQPLAPPHPPSHDASTVMLALAMIVCECMRAPLYSIQLLFWSVPARSRAELVRKQCFVPALGGASRRTRSTFLPSGKEAQGSAAPASVSFRRLEQTHTAMYFPKRKRGREGRRDLPLSLHLVRNQVSGVIS